ncbi:hypothetical protein [Methanogenium cariaci]|uniref:hypothetical protein n=1 Tax=Methanogenium cariaci TaxID=2197 RepID=UPI0012F6B307|nr:hypothetical protein [Methanogenium cariaci]
MKEYPVSFFEKIIRGTVAYRITTAILLTGMMLILFLIPLSPRTIMKGGHPP